MGDLPRPEALTGQETALRAFSAALSSRRVAGAYLLIGPAGVGRSLGAAVFANALLCEAPRGLVACGTCRACRWNAAGTHPDLLVLGADTGPRFDDDEEAARAGSDRFSRAARQSDERRPRRTIAVRALRRMMEILSLSAAGGGWKVAVIDAFDDVEEEGTAALLKTLEEAPPRTTFLLLARDADAVPDTVLSRCQRVRFRPLDPASVRRVALDRGGDAVRRLDAQGLDLVVRLAQGSPGRAIAAAASGIAGEPRAAIATIGTEPAPSNAFLAWVRGEKKDTLDAQRDRAREALALALLDVRDRWDSGAAGGVAAIRQALESLGANVAPEWTLRALWARARRSRSLTV